MALIKEKIKQQNKEEYAYNKMLGYGWTPDQAAGIVGNLKHESGLNTGSEGDVGYKRGSSFGLAQWREKRLETLKSKYGSNWKDLDSQLDFVNWELNNTHKKVGDRLRNTQGIYNTGALISDKYEIPAKKFHENKDRQKAVYSIYEKYSGMPFTPEEFKGTAQRAIDSYTPNQQPVNQTTPIYTPEVINFVEPIKIDNLAESNETQAVQKAKEELDYKQQQQINQQKFIQDLLTASQVQYVDPNQIQQEDIYNQDQVYQRGGTYYDLPMNNANPITPRQFTIDYIKSPKYRERLINSGYEDIDGEIKRRLSGANPEVFPYKSPPAQNIIQTLLGKKQDEGERGSYYSPFTKRIQLDSKYDNDTFSDVYSNTTPPTAEEIETHERSHATTSDFPEDRFNKTDIRRLNNYHKIDPSIPEHDLIPGENKADLDAFRYLLKKEGVYDAGKQDFTPEIFKKTKKSATKDRLQSVYSDEAIIYLMNKVAQNDIQDNITYGQNGGVQQSRDFLKNWYQNRELPDPSLNATYQAEKNLYASQSQNLPAPNYVNQIDDANTQGTYDINTNKIDILQNADPLVYTHEATHGINLPLKDTQSNVNAFSIIGQNVIPQENIQNQWVKDNYKQISNYQEIIPRLNAYRQKYGLQPNQVITPELIQQNRQKYTNTADFEDNTDQLYKLFQDEGLSNVLNKVVSVDTNNQYYGQMGGAMSSSFGQTGLLNILPETLLRTNLDKRKSSDLVKIKSSLNDGEINYVRTAKPTDVPLKRNKVIEQQASEDFVNWYSDPATKERFTKNTGLDANRLQDFIGKGLRTPMREAENNEDIGYLSKLGADALYTSPYFQQTNNRPINDKTGEILYQRQRESTPYSKAPDMRSVLGHELSHASNVDGVIAPALQRVLGDVNNQQKGTFKRDREYLAHPEETYGNFHMFRQNLGLKPGQQVDIKQLQQLVKEKGLDEEIFYKAYDDDKIVKAINTIAQNNPETSNIYAQNGGIIPVSSNGVYDFPYQQVLVPTDSGRITMKNVNYPILGIDEHGNEQMMYPNQEYQFKGRMIHEIPQLKRTKNKRFS